MSDERALAQWAARQHGLITIEQVRTAGFSNGTVQRRVDTGTWQRVEHGVLRIGGSPYTWHTRVLAACLASGGRASHRTAAHLYGLDRFPAGPPELIVPRGCGYRRRDVRVHEVRDFAIADERRPHGIPTTGPAVTLFHLGALLGHREQAFAIDDALRKKLADWPDLYCALGLHARRGRRGTRQYRALLDARFGEVVPDSRWNRMVAELLTDAGLPAPVLEYEVVADDGLLVARVDLAYPDLRLAIELQSVRWHLGEEALDRDTSRRNRLLQHGWLVLEYTWRAYVDEPGRLCGEVRDAWEVRHATLHIPNRRS